MLIKYRIYRSCDYTYLWELFLKVGKALFARNQVDESNAVLRNSILNKFLDAHNHTSSCGEHGIKNEYPLFRLNIFRQLAVVKDRVLVNRIFISLNKNFSHSDSWKNIHDFLYHSISWPDNGDCAVILRAVLKPLVVVVLSSRRKSFFYYLRFLTNGFLKKQTHNAVWIASEKECVCAFFP